MPSEAQPPTPSVTARNVFYSKGRLFQLRALDEGGAIGSTHVITLSDIGVSYKICTLCENMGQTNRIVDKERIFPRTPPSPILYSGCDPLPIILLTLLFTSKQLFPPSTER
jgi:hypothetical protein